MPRNKGTFKFAASYEVREAYPLDPRMLVETKQELITQDTWPTKDTTIYVYNGLLVSVQDEKAVYMLVDKTKILNEDYSGWKRVDGNSPGEVSYEDIYIIEDITAQDIEGYVGEQLRIDGRGLSEAIDSNKRVYIKYSNNAGAGIIPCSAYKDDVYYVSFRLNSSLYGFDIDADSQYIDENYIFHIDIQEKLESGKNIKTINGQSILGRGNLKIEGLSSAIPDWNENNPSDASYIKNRTHYKVEDISYGTSMGYGDSYYNDDDTPITPNRIRVRSEEGFVSDWINVYDGYGEYFEELYLYDEYGDIQDTYTGTISVDMGTSGVELDMGTSNYYVDLDYSTIKQLDEEFIPDTIARKSDIVGGDSGVQTRLDEIDIEIEDLQNMKIDKENDDYYPNMSVGVADNLSGVDVVASEFTTRQSGGGAILDGTARIEAIKGNSVVWNQLLDTSDYISHQNGIDVIKDNENNFVVNGTTEDNEAWIKCHKGTFTLVQGHKYLVTGCPKGGSGTTYSLVEGNGIIQPDFGDGCISECSRDIATVMYIVVRKNTTVTNLKYCPLVFDLTRMFGAGNEPATVEEFYQRLPIEADNRYYVEGEMFHFRPTGIWSYDKSGSTKRLQDLSIVLALFPDGMKSTGAVNDEIRWNAEIQKWEKIQRVEEVNLGELNYYKSSEGEHRFYTTDLRDKIAKNTESLISARFIYGQVDDDKASVISDTIGTVYFSLPSCTDVTAFKEVVQGVTLCYELATPKTTILDEDFSRETGLNVDFNLDYQVWNEGREELVADNPCSALKADIVYGFNAYGKIKELEEKLNNGGGGGVSQDYVDSKLTELSAEVGNKVGADFVNNAIATAITNELTADF